MAILLLRRDRRDPEGPGAGVRRERSAGEWRSGDQLRELQPATRHLRGALGPERSALLLGKQFPERYRGGAFVAFHGGFDRAPLPNEGYQVQFVPFGANGMPSGAAETFADGFAGSTGPLPATALHRPVDVTEGPDGSLYVSDDRGGRIYRIIFRGQ